MSNMSDDLSIDEFAQTRAPDDLFDDDFTPVAEPTTLTQPQHAPVPTGPRASRGDHSQRGGRGRGKGRGRGANEGHSEAKAESSGEKPERMEAGPTSRGDRAATGDRTATGGIAKPKLTESELEARLASIRLRNAALEAAHRRAEADEASFQEREQRELAKRVEERANRRVLEGEREKNRQRKLKTVEGREWDAEKTEEDYSSGGRGGSAFSRGAHGSVVRGRGGHRNVKAEFGGAFSRGRGDLHFGSRGRGDFNAPRGPRGAGRGRGGFAAGGTPTRETGPISHKGEATEFPALPSPKNGIPDKKSPLPPKLTFPITPPPNPKAQKPDSPNSPASKTGFQKPSSPKRPNYKWESQKSNSPKPGNSNGGSPKSASPRPQDQTLPGADGASDKRPNNQGPPQATNKEVSSAGSDIDTKGASSAEDATGTSPKKIAIPPLQSPTTERGTWAEQMEARTPTT